MSIATAITNAQAKVASAYEVCEDKGATMPVDQNLTNLADTIDSIETKVPINEAIQVWAAETTTDPNTQEETKRYYRDEVEIGNVTTIPTQTFQNNTEILDVLIPDTITNTGTYTFDGCSSLRSVNLENATEIGGYCFQNCTGLTSVNVPNVETFGGYCFSGCTNLTNINFGDKVTTIKGRAFNSVPITGDINFPNLTGYLGDTGVRAFYNTDITSVSNLGTITRIKDEAFRSCDSLESAILPSTITNVSYMTFYACPLLDWVTILATTPPSLGSSVFGGSYKARVRVPYSSDHSILTAYRTAESWTSFANRVYEMDPTLQQLPSGYTELDYITCAGTQWLDTGLVGNQFVSADISFYSNYTNTTMGLFGRNTGDNSTSILVNIANSSGTTRLGGGYRSMGWGTQSDWNISIRYNSVTRWTTATSWSGTVGEFTTGDTMLLGWTGASSTNKFKGNIRSCRIWMSGILVRDFKPCKNDSDVVGMWDAVNGVFYPSVSGTDFTS